MGLKPLPVPDTMTGGVDLTGVADLTGNGDTLARLNKQPEVINTLTGGHDQGMIPNVNMPADPVTENAPPGKDVTRGLEEVARAYDGVPVRVRPASRFRTFGWTLTPGASMVALQADSRRLRAVITCDFGDGNCVIFVGHDYASAGILGYPLRERVPLELLSGDQIAIAAFSGNGETVDVFMLVEIAE